MNIVSSVSSKSIANIKLVLAAVVVAMVASHVYAMKVADKSASEQEKVKKQLQMVNYGVVGVLGFLVVALHMQKKRA
jgi:hypothetical protein